LEPGRNYEVEIKKVYYLPKQIDVNTDSIPGNSDIELKDVKIEPIPSKAIVFHNIYFDFNQSVLSQESKNTIDTTILEVMQEYPEIVVEIGAHTDCIGTEDYNLKLSQDRALSVTNYLIAKGIAPERLKAVGYGSEFPIAPSITPEGIDIPEGREKNRRIEFKLIGFIEK
jgi:outer membrane protein OmpA-like peptidoglycan-associated protein